MEAVETLEEVEVQYLHNNRLHHLMAMRLAAIQVEALEEAEAEYLQNNRLHHLMTMRLAAIQVEAMEEVQADIAAKPAHLPNVLLARAPMQPHFHLHLILVVSLPVLYFLN